MDSQLAVWQTEIDPAHFPAHTPPVMPHLSWNEVRDRAIRFSRNPDWVNATSERSDKQTFYNEFFEVFGIRRASVATPRPRRQRTSGLPGQN
jgi:hypothetical protein